MKAIICDRCGKTQEIECEYYFDIILKEMSIDGNVDNTYYEICNECKQKFAEWMGEGKK
jgi:hypothetical protein